MSTQKPLYLKPEEYLEVIHGAHSRYIKSRFDGAITAVFGAHTTDLATESAAFFETSFLVLDSLAEYYSKIEAAKKQAVLDFMKAEDPDPEPEPDPEPKSQDKIKTTKKQRGNPHA